MNRKTFFAVVVFVFSALYAYMSWSLAGPFDTRAWIWLGLGLPFASILGFIAMVVSDKWSARAANFAFVSMGWLSFLLVLVLARDLMLVEWHSRESTWILFGAAAALFVVANVIATQGLRVKRVTLEFAGLPKDLDGFRIAQASDLHIGPMIGAGFIRKVVERINGEKPDSVVLTGDIGDGEVSEHRAATLELAKLAPQGRVFYATGNHEFYWDGPAWMDAFRGAGLRVLANSNEVLQVGAARLAIAGVLDPAAAMAGLRPDLGATLAGAEGAGFKLLLAHQPTFAPLAEKAGFDLQLSGHTHGGQFFPWTLLVRLFHKFHKGRFEVGEKMQLYVNPGTGTWGPRVRLGTRPEITLITLKQGE